MTKNTSIVAYHDPCTDGFTSAWITRKALLKDGVEVITVPMTYTDESYRELLNRVITYRPKELFIVDFSIPVDWLESYTKYRPALRVTILDHHKSAFENYMGDDYEVQENSKEQISFDDMDVSIYLDNSQSGAGMCWRWFNATSIPYLVMYVEDYDLWRFKYEDNTRYMNKFLRIQDQTFERWDELGSILEYNDIRTQALDLGKKIQKDHDAEVEHRAEKAKPVRISGATGMFVAAPYELVSDVGHMVSAEHNCFCLMVEVPLLDQTDIPWSLRSNGDLDVSLLARTMRGGGHKNAAGFTISREESVRLLTRINKDYEERTNGVPRYVQRSITGVE